MYSNNELKWDLTDCLAAFVALCTEAQQISRAHGHGGLRRLKADLSLGLQAQAWDPQRVATDQDPLKALLYWITFVMSLIYTLLYYIIIYKYVYVLITLVILLKAKSIALAASSQADRHQAGSNRLRSWEHLEVSPRRSVQAMGASVHPNRWDLYWIKEDSFILSSFFRRILVSSLSRALGSGRRTKCNNFQAAYSPLSLYFKDRHCREKVVSCTIHVYFSCHCTQCIELEGPKRSSSHLEPPESSSRKQYQAQRTHSHVFVKSVSEPLWSSSLGMADDDKTLANQIRSATFLFSAALWQEILSVHFMRGSRLASRLCEKDLLTRTEKPCGCSESISSAKGSTRRSRSQAVAGSARHNPPRLLRSVSNHLKWEMLSSEHLLAWELISTSELNRINRALRCTP